MLNLRSRPLVWIASLLIAISVWGSQFPVLADTISLAVTKGPGPNEVTLQWAGGTAPYQVFGGGSAASVLDPPNLRVTTSATFHIDAPPSGAITYYSVIGQGPPEIQSITPDGASFGDNIVVFGQNFGIDRSVVRVRFSFTEPTSLENLTIDQPVFAVNGTRIELAVPMATPNRVNQVTVLVNGIPSNTVGFLVGELPPDPTPALAGNETIEFVNETDALVTQFDGKLDAWFVQTGVLTAEQVATFHTDMAEIHAAMEQMRTGVLGHSAGDLAAMDCIVGTPAFQGLLAKVREARASLHGSPLGSIMCEGRQVRDVVRDIIDVINVIDDILDAVQTALNAACVASSILAIFSVGFASPLAAVICTAAALVNTIVAPIMDAITSVSSVVDFIASAAPVDLVDNSLDQSITHALWGGEPAYVYVQGNVPNEARLTQDFHNASCLPSGCDYSFSITIYGVDIPITITVPHMTVYDLRMTCEIPSPAPVGYVDMGTTGDNDVCQFTGADVGSGWVRGTYSIQLQTTCGTETVGPVSQPFTLVSGPKLTSISPESSQLRGSIDLYGQYMPPAVTGNLAYAKADYGDIGGQMVFSEDNHYRFRVPDTANPSGHVSLVVQGRSSDQSLSFTVLPPVLTKLRINPAFEGEEVELHGTGFASYMPNNHLTINGQPAVADRDEPFGLVFRVPSGAVSGPVQVTAVTHVSNTLNLDVRRWGAAPGVALSHPDRDAANPVVAAHADGTVGALWVDRHGSGGGSRLLFTDAAPSDGGFRAPVAIAPTTGGTELAGPPSTPQSPDLAIGPDHRFHAVWTNPLGQVLISSFAKGAPPAAPVVAIAPAVGRVMRDPAVAVMSDGSVHVAATEVPIDGDVHSALKHAISSNGGISFGTPVSFRAAGTGSLNDDLQLGEIDLTYANGKLWRAWTQFAYYTDPYEGETPQREVFTQSSIDGINWTLPEGAGAGKIAVSHSGAPTSSRNAPSVSGDDNGAVAAWDIPTTAPYASSGPTRIYASHQVEINAEPYTRAGVGRVTPPSAGNQTEVSHASLVHQLSSGEPVTAVASVRRIPGSSPDVFGGVPRVHVRRFPLRDTTASTLFETNPTVLAGDTSTEDAAPSLAVDGADHYHLVWLQGPAGHRIVRYQTTRVQSWPDTLPDNPPPTLATPREVIAVNMGANYAPSEALYHWGVLLMNTSHSEETRWVGVSPIPGQSGRQGRASLGPDGTTLFHGHGNLYGAALASPDGMVRLPGLDAPSSDLYMTDLEFPTIGNDGRYYGLVPVTACSGCGYYNSDLFRSDLITGQFSRIPGVTLQRTRPHYAVSRQGDYVAWTDSDFGLHVYDIVNNLDRMPPNPNWPATESFDFSPIADKVISSDWSQCSWDLNQSCRELGEWDLPSDTRQVLAEAEFIMQPQVKPDGSAVVYRCGGQGCCDPTAIEAEMAICTTTGQMVPRTPGITDVGPVWSPDGTRIAFLRYDNISGAMGQLMVWDLASNTVAPLSAPVLGLPQYTGAMYELVWRTVQP